MIYRSIKILGHITYSGNFSTTDVRFHIVNLPTEERVAKTTFFIEPITYNSIQSNPSKV